MEVDLSTIFNSSNVSGNLSRQDLNVTQGSFFLFSEQSDVLAQVCQEIFVDFQKICTSGGSFDDIVDGFRETASNGIQIFERAFSGQKKTNPRIKSMIESLKVERNAYDLIQKLFKAESLANGIEEPTSVLTRLYSINSEFRRLITLLHWSEEVAFSSPSGFSQILNELTQSDGTDPAFIASAHHKQFCHIDSVYLSKLPDSDLKNLNRIKQIFFCLLRCGRFAKCADLLERAGLSAMKVFLQVREVLTDPNCTPTDIKASNYGFAEARLHFKNTANNLLTLPNDNIGDIDRCIWATLAGNLSALLTYAEQPEDILWSYVNSAVEALFDEEVWTTHSVEDDELNESGESIRSVDSVFAGFSDHCDSVYFKIIGSLASENFDHVIELAYDDLHGTEDVDTNKLRMYTHMTLLIKDIEFQHDVDKGESIICKYANVLNQLGLYGLVPYYYSKIDRELGTSEMVNFLYQIQGQDSRLEALTAADEAGFNIRQLCIAVHAKAKADNPFDGEGSIADSIAKLLDSWKFLIIFPEMTRYEALVECNYLLRQLFLRDRLAEAMELLAIAPTKLSTDIEPLVQEMQLTQTPENSKKVHMIQDEQREHNSYLLYLEVIEKFSFWQNHVKEALPDRPKKLNDADYSKLSNEQMYEYERRMKAAHDKMASHLKSSEYHKSAAVDKIVELLQQVSTWLVSCLECSDVVDDAQHQTRVSQLGKIHEHYLFNVITMLITLHSQCRNELEALKVASILTDSRYDLYQHLSKASLRKIFAELAKSGYVLAVNNSE